jgi:regulator of cell morphogenesis and NO signaling
MDSLDLDTSVPEWIVEHPQILRLLESLAIDYCCGGKSLRYACHERGLNAEDVLNQIHALLHGCDK